MPTTRFVAFTRSHSFAVLVAVIGFLFIGGVIFLAGMDVGFRRAEFSGRFGTTYAREFGGPHGTFFAATGMPGGHGAFGTIVSANGGTLIIATAEQPEQQVAIATDTMIRDGRDTVDASALTTGTSVVVLGVPDANGVIDAKLIRVLPAPGMLPPPSH